MEATNVSLRARFDALWARTVGTPGAAASSS